MKRVIGQRSRGKRETVRCIWIGIREVQCILKRLSHLSEGFLYASGHFCGSYLFSSLSFFWENIYFPILSFASHGQLRRAVFFFFRLDIPLGVHCGTLLFFLLSLQSAQTGSFGIFAWRSDDDGT
jgi:hypothetical protein